MKKIDHFTAYAAIRPNRQVRHNIPWHTLWYKVQWVTF